MLSRHSIRLLVSALALISLTGCGRMFNAMMGMHAYQKEVPQERIDRMRNSMGLPGTNDLYLTRAYYDSVSAMVRPGERFQQALLQPLQLRYFDDKGDLVSLLMNCDVGGFPNLKWERYHVVDSVPIRKPAFLDSLWTLSSDMQFMRTYSGAALEARQMGEHHVNVYWSYRMGRQFKRLKRTMDEMQTRHIDQVTVWYVNVDSLYTGLEH